MRFATPVAIVVAGALLSGAILFSSGQHRYQLVPSQYAGGVVRLDTRTGETVVCLIQRGRADPDFSEVLIAPCTGRK